LSACWKDLADILTPEVLHKQEPPLIVAEENGLLASSETMWQRNNSSCYICQSEWS
jgi:hypothetical protein